MGQVLIRNLDDDVIAAYRAAALANARSLEAELREGLNRGRPNKAVNRREIARRVRARLPAEVMGPDSTDVIRWYRDTNGGRDSDAF
jgi:hypothetical protein